MMEMIFTILIIRGVYWGKTTGLLLKTTGKTSGRKKSRELLGGGICEEFRRRKSIEVFTTAVFKD